MGFCAQRRQKQPQDKLGRRQKDQREDGLKVHRQCSGRIFGRGRILIFGGSGGRVWGGVRGGLLRLGMRFGRLRRWNVRRGLCYGRLCKSFWSLLLVIDEGM